jgi:glycosyltransferase involved in cell wall biosynthesis
MFGGAPRAAAEAATPRAEPRARVCLVTAEFHGLFKNGGIGTANTGLALELAAAGAEVVVLFVDSDSANHKGATADLAKLKAHYRGRGITLEMLPRDPLVASSAEGHLAASFSVYAYLQARSFDVVFFNECGGQGYYALLAKRAGLFRDPPRMCVVAHGSLAWVLEINGQLCWGLRPIAMNFVERRGVELADELISPSRYLAGWMASRGWALPRQVHVIQNIVPGAAAPVPAPETAAVREFVFFGRLEARKGLELFCDAIDRLAGTHDLSGVAITFMGKFSKIGGLHSGVYIIERSRGWKVHPKIVTHFDQTQALEYLGRPGALAVIPSMAENSPCVVAECLMLGIPFIATDSGGTVELVAEDDRAKCLVAADPEALRAKLAAVLADGQGPARLAITVEETKARWREFVATQVETKRAERETPSRPARSRVTICVAHPRGSAPDPRLIESIRAQTWSEIELIVAAYGADPDPIAEVAAPAGGLAFTAPVSDRGEAKNAAAARASGDFLMFVDEDGVILKPECVEVYVGVADRLSLDVVTGVPLEFDREGSPREGWDGQITYFPLGAAKEYAAFENGLGHSVIMIGRRKFEAIGGFESGVDRQIEDWLLLTRAILAGAVLEVAPAPLYWLRAKRSRPFEVQRRVSDQRRILSAYAAEKAGTLADALESVIVWSPQSRDLTLGALAGAGGVARTIATDLSFTYTPTDPDSFKLFVEYCIARGRFREALDFADMTDPAALAPIARAAAEAMAEKVAFDAVKRVDRDIARPLDMTGLASERVRCLSGSRNAAVTREPGIVGSIPISPGPAILKAPAICPPGARSFEVTVSQDGAAGAFALAVCEPGAPMQWVEDRIVAAEGVSLSDWTRLSGDGGAASARVSFDPAPDRPLDVFVIGRSDEGASAAGRLTWLRASAVVSVFDLAAPGEIAADPASWSLPRAVLDRAELLTPLLDFPTPYFAPGNPIMHHPLPGRAAVVRIRGAIFSGAAGVSATCSVQNPQARPIEFALWARRSTEPAADEATLAGSIGSSGWTAVRAPFQQRRIGFDLPELAREPLDLYLATRVVEFPDVNWCHAAWHDISIIERLVSER